jgi:hypothetical protein
MNAGVQYLIYLEVQFSPFSVLDGVRWGVADHVLVPQAFRNLRANVVQLPNIPGEEDLPACQVHQFLQDVLAWNVAPLALRPSFGPRLRQREVLTPTRLQY